MSFFPIIKENFPDLILLKILPRLNATPSSTVELTLGIYSEHMQLTDSDHYIERWLAGVYNDWLIYTEYDYSERTIYMTRSDGTEPRIILEDSYLIPVVLTDNEFYCATNIDEYGIYKISLPSLESTKIYASRMSTLNIYNI